MKHKRTLVADIQEEGYLVFLSMSGDRVDKAALFLVDSQFKNLRGFEISTGGAEVTIKNTSFENLEMDESFLSFIGVDSCSHTS